MLPALEGFAAATLGALNPQDLAATSADLSRLELTVLGSVELRAVLTDTSLTGAQRAAVSRDILAGKVTATAIDLCAYAAHHAPAQDVPGQWGDLAYFSQVLHEHGRAEFASLSLLEARRRVAGFADAVLQGVATADFANIEDQLFRFARALEGSSDLRRVLLDRDATLSGRLGLIETLLAGKVSATSLSLARFAVEGGRPRDLVGTLDFLVDHVAAARQWRVARVRSARDITASDRDQLVASLRKVTGRDVELHVAIDETLLGGVLVEVGDLRLDATMRGRLHSLRDVVTAGRAASLPLTNE
jgi:F-type H+-transporting ATPase subunit delta